MRSNDSDDEVRFQSPKLPDFCPPLLWEKNKQSIKDI